MGITDTAHALRVIHDTLVVKGENAYDLVNKVDQMYQCAWTRLLATGAVIMTIATIIIPWYLNYIRNKQIDVDKQATNNLINKRVDEIKSEIAKEFDQRIKDELIALATAVEADVNSVKAATYYLLAESKMDKADYSYAFVNYVTALQYSLAAKDLANIKGTLASMGMNCIPKLRVVDIQTSEKMYNFNVESILKKIEDVDENRLLFEDINKFRQAIGAVAQRETQAE